MTRAKTKSVSVERFRYVLDWYEIDKVEIDLSKPCYFEFDYRCGSWYLEQYVQQDDHFAPWKAVYLPKGNAFNMQSPGDALAVLGEHVRTLKSSNSYGAEFLKDLAQILARAKVGAQ